MSGKPLTPSKITAFRNAIETCQLADQQRLQLQLQRLVKRLQTNKPADQMADRLQQQIDRSLACVTQRAQTRPVLSFPEELPITGHLEALVKAVQKNSVVVIAGETGSGKSTQIPKICLKAGLGLRGEIAMTQPRRIAARSIASRLAEETQTAMGDVVGYQVRFDQQVSEQTRVRVMTDGLLLAQTRDDPSLRRYDTIIIDEAHERSLNIDFLLGVVKRLLQQRDDLKVIITSATIDTEKFAQFFDDAPVFTVSGRGYPVEILYDESAAQEERDTTQAVVDAVKTLQSRMPSGDILAFFAGERDIREAAEALAKAGLKDTEVLPLYARLGRAEQQRIFHPGDLRRVVLATNVAETSLTVPRIHAVIDTGFARISRYSPRSKVQRLPIEPISQASANQRAGRCGRLGPGICVRLYDEQDFLDRPEFTEPEIQRTGLASVILHMLVMRLGEIESFPFVDAPSRALIKDGYQLLRELDALDAHNDVTPIGRQLARLPLDVRYARMLVAARSLDCVDAALTIVAGLSIQDPRERPHQATQEADQAHARFADPRSDFASLLRLYGAFEKQRKAAGSAAVKRWCHQHFVHYLRMREWRDLRRQLSDLIKEANWQWQVPDEPDLDKTHQACLAGLLSHVGRKEPDKHFSGVRQRRFYLFPGSVLAKKPPKWVMAAEIVETSQTFARVNAPIDPAWIEHLAPDLLKHTTFDPHWSDNKQQAMAYEQVSLFGLVIVEKRRVALAPNDPTTAREIFIRDGLVGQKLRSNLPFYQFNGQLREQLETLEHQSRRRDILVEEARLVDFLRPSPGRRGRS